MIRTVDVVSALEFKCSQEKRVAEAIAQAEREAADVCTVFLVCVVLLTVTGVFMFALKNACAGGCRRTRTTRSRIRNRGIMMHLRVENHSRAAVVIMFSYYVLHPTRLAGSGADST